MTKQKINSISIEIKLIKKVWLKFRNFNSLKNNYHLYTVFGRIKTKCLYARRSLSANLSSQVTVSAWLQTILTIDLSSMNPRSGYLFNQACQSRHLNQISWHILSFDEKVLFLFRSKRNKKDICDQINRESKSCRV